MFSWPGVIQPGQSRRAALLQYRPIVPYAARRRRRADPASELPGLNLLPDPEIRRPRPATRCIGETFAHDIASLDRPADSLVYRWVIEGKWKLLLTYDGAVSARYASSNPRDEKRPQLFDLLADPHENKNLAAQNPAAVARLAAKLDTWWRAEGRSTQTTWTP